MSASIVLGLKYKGTTKCVIEPSYNVKIYDHSNILFYYTFDANTALIVDYNKLSDQVTNAPVDTSRLTLFCTLNRVSSTACNKMSVIYGDRTGDSIILLIQQQFEDSY